ncbi:MAG: ATP-binding protein [Candidatus Micrarchaeia archaeon]
MGENFDFDDTSQIAIPKNLVDQIIGQDEAVKIAKMVARQRRHLLLVGPPGTGKSMLARAISSMLSKADEEISVMHNPAKPERPFLEVRTRAEVEQKQKPKSKKEQKPVGLMLKPTDVPSFVSERLGYKCRYCSKFSNPDVSVCPSCNAEKFRESAGPFGDLLANLGDIEREDAVHTTRILEGKEELVVFERVDERTIRALDQKELAMLNGGDSSLVRNVIVPLDRKLFVQATGASETELLGDVRHDPYGGHHQIGTPAFTRVVPGAVHEAHEGVLFVDELISLGNLQRNLLTAMQDKKFPISGRNSSSTGSSVRVDSVPCDFILVSAVNMADIQKIMVPLRSRISGNGYEVLLNSVMDDNAQNANKIAQFIAQEIVRDGRIPHASRESVELILNHARKKARIVDKKAGISLRLRSLSGLIKSAGDWARAEDAKLIEPKHVKAALVSSKMAEEQMSQMYGSFFAASMSDTDLSSLNSADKDAR